jgi:hypothetical protein
MPSLVLPGVSRIPLKPEDPAQNLDHRLSI